MIFPYLYQSFRRRPLRHISIYWIMLCAFLLPLVVSVYRDSLEYGNQLQLRNDSKEQAFHISGASPEDVEWFRNIEGLTAPIYENGTIYLTFESEEAWKRFTDYNHPDFDSDDWMDLLEEQNRIDEALDSGIVKSGHALSVSIYEYDMWHGLEEDPVWKSQMQEILFLNIALLLFSGVIVYSAYRNHIAGFSQEASDLGALGAAKVQIIRLFLAEFVILFPLAAVSAIGLSWIVMRFLYQHFLGNTASSVTVWEVFHMDPQNTALEILFYFLVCLCAMAGSVLHGPTKRKMKKCRYRSASLPALWMHQTKPPFFRCLFVLVPLLTAFVLLFNRYLSIYTQNVYNVQTSKINVTSAERGFSQEELNMLYELDGVQRIEQMKNSDRLFLLFTPEGDELMAFIHSYRDCNLQLQPLEGYEIAADLPGSEAADGAYYLADMGLLPDKTEVKLTRVLEREYQDSWRVDVYVSDALMQELTANAPVTKLEIYTSAQFANSLEEELRNKLPSDYSVYNFQNGVDAAAARQEGRLLLLSWIFCILMLVAMQIIWGYLARYVDDCGAMLRILFHVGASRRQVANLIPVWIGAVPAVVLPFVIAIPWAKLEAAQTNRPFIISIPVLCIYLGIGVLAVLTFWCPIKYSLRRVLKESK